MKSYKIYQTYFDEYSIEISDNSLTITINSLYEEEINQIIDYLTKQNYIYIEE